jgi:hypothetical protein
MSTIARTDAGYGAHRGAAGSSDRLEEMTIAYAFLPGVTRVTAA